MTKLLPTPVSLLALCGVVILISCVAGNGQDAGAASETPSTLPSTQPAGGGDVKVGHFPFVEFDIQKREVRVECESLAVDAPLEFFVCTAGTAEHESVLRTKARPSHVHTALLAIGLKPGQPLTYMEATKKWLPPQGPPLHMTVEYQKDGKTIRYPAYRWIRDIKTKKEQPAFTWIFAGSRVTPEGRYGADDTGYFATLVNFDFAMIDVPELASSSNDLLEWERNADLMPPRGSPVTLIIEPAGAAIGGPATQPGASGSSPATQSALPPEPAVGSQAVESALAAPGTEPANSAENGNPGSTTGPLSDVKIDEQKVQGWIDYHNKVLAPRQDALRMAAEAHYKVISQLRAEQQRLINEADRIQRAIDQLERDWADATTPRPPRQ